MVAQERLEKSGFCDIIHDIIEKAMISCISLARERLSYDILHDIMVCFYDIKYDIGTDIVKICMISYMISYTMLKFCVDKSPYMIFSMISY